MERLAHTRTAVLCVLVAWCGNAHAALLDDFDSLAIGAIDGRGGWSAGSDMTAVVRDFTRDGDHVLRLAGDNTTAYRSLGDLLIPDGQVSTLFFRFSAGAGNYDHGVGLSDDSSPASFSSFDVNVLFRPDAASVEMRARDGSVNRALSLNGGGAALDPGTWYDTWIVINHATDTANVYLRGGTIAQQRLVGEGLRFRHGDAAGALRSFQAQIGGGSLATLLLDDIHLTAGESLDTPATPKSEARLDADAIDHIFALAGQKLAAAEAVLPAGQFPEKTAVTGEWTTTNKWTQGFYPGLLWQMYGRTRDDQWRTAAEHWTQLLADKQYNTGTHDVGFMLMSSYGRGYALTGNEAWRQVLINGANSLAQRFDPRVGAIRSLKGLNEERFQVLIDNMMNLELLFWAADNGGDAHLRDIAVQHAYTTMREHVRADGSTYHHVDFSFATGKVTDKYTNQGYHDESTWARGQAWALYGFTMAYRYTGDPHMLATAIATADYFLDHLPADFIPPNDFDAPPGTPKDTSAAAIVASGLLELCTYVDSVDADRYFDAAENILLSLAGPHYLTEGTPFASLLSDGSIAYRSKSGEYVGLIYGDYYFIEALERYQNLPEPSAASVLALICAGLLFRRSR